MPTRSPWTSGHPPGELLSSYVDGEVDPDLRTALESHVEACADCSRQVVSFRSLRLALRNAPSQRAPMSLNREVWQRIEQHDATARRGFRLPTTPRLVAFGTNALALAAIAVLLAVIAPGADALIRQLALSTSPDASTTAAQPTVQFAAAVPTSTAWPTEAATPPTATSAPATQVPTSTPGAVDSLDGDAGSRPPPVASRQDQLTPRPIQAATLRPDATRVPAPTGAPTAQAAAVKSPTATSASAPTLRAVSGTVSFVDRKARTITVTANGPGGERPVSVILSDGTQYSRADGRRTAFEDVGIADQVEVSGFEGGTQAGGILASSLRISVSAVSAAPQMRSPRVIFVVDGAESIRAGQYAQTGDWARRLATTGYEVTTADPSRVAWTAATLKGFDLVVIGAPATLSDAAISFVRASQLPILIADPRLVQTLGLGVNVDPANPLRQAPAGRTIDIVQSGSPVTRGLSTGETVVARESLFRTPIVSNGTILATVLDAGQRRAIWAQTGTSIYLGAWNSSNGANHTDAYWSMFDRSVVALLGRDPGASVSANKPVPTATRTAR